MEHINIELILHRLDEISNRQVELALKQEEFGSKLSELSENLVKMKTVEKTVDGIKEWKVKMQEVISTSELEELKLWKGKMEEQMSPKQLTTHLAEHENFKTFKTQAMMIWIVVQSLMAIAIFWNKIFQ